jgi:hypothetical protein
MSIRGAEGLSFQELQSEVARGAKIVIFEYCISIVVLSFKRSSDPFLVRAGEGTFGKSWPYILISLLFGWWGFPWGFIYTPMTLITNLGGGRDVTGAILSGDPD